MDKIFDDPIPENIHFGKLIEQIVKKRSHDLEAEAARWGYSKNALYKIFKKKDVGTDILKKVARLYQVRIETLLSGSQNLYQKGYINAANESVVTYNRADNAIRVKELEAKVESLEEQNKLLREMVEILKGRDK